ncbi:MAG: hypothetical protein LBL62_08905 [Planctomycetaceae bacterium]|nr:hypothetical protein [Planctomycetaceae bacterium]
MKGKPFWSRVRLNRRDLLAKGRPPMVAYLMIACFSGNGVIDLRLSK